MSGCKKSVKPKPFGITICTSDVNCFDGNLACLGVPPNSDLNDILEILATAICNFTPPPVSVDAAVVTYSGTTAFKCFTLTGTNVEDVIEELANKICSVSSDVSALTGNTMTIGNSFVAPYLSFLGSKSIYDVFTDVITKLCTVSADLDTVRSAYVPSSDLVDLTRGNDLVILNGNRALFGLFLTMSSSRYFVNGVSYTKSLSPNIPLAATSDNYVDFDDSIEDYVVTSVPISAPAPPVTGIRLWMFTTNEVGVTAESDLRVYGWVDNTILLDDTISAAKLQNLSVTGAKLETIGVATTVGDSAFFQFSYDTKGRVTASVSKIDIGFSTALADQDILIYDLTNDVWKNAPIIGTLLPSATDNQTLRYDVGASNYVATSFLLNTGSEIGIGINNGLPLEAFTIGDGRNQAFQLGDVTGFTANGVGGGVLAAGTYYYVISAMDGVGTTLYTTEISESVDGAITTAIDLAWNEQPSTAFYRIWRGTVSGTYGLYRDVYGTPDVTDDGTGWIVGVYAAPTNISAYGIYIGSSDIIYGDRSLHLSTDVTTYTNYSASKTRLFNINQFADIDGGAPSDVIAARINVNTTARNTTNVNYGLFVEDVIGSDVTNVGGKIITSDSTAGDNIGLWIKSTNAGAGTAIGIVVENGGAVMGATSIDASSILELVSTTQGFLPPRMTTAQRNAIAAPAVGLVIYNTTTNKLNVYTGAWEQVTSV